MKIKILKIIFQDIAIYPRDIPKLRGFFANKYPEYVNLHNHNGDKFIYKLPNIQYRNINGKAALIGFGDGLDLLKKIFFEVEEVKIGSIIYPCNEKQISLKEYDFGISKNPIKYKFISPWMALNQENHKKYINSKIFAQKQILLENILLGNLLSLSKNFNYTIPDTTKLSCKINNLKPIKVNFKNQKMQCFKCDFKVNFHIPTSLGLGKSVARGFGVV